MIVLTASTVPRLLGTVAFAPSPRHTGHTSHIRHATRRHRRRITPQIRVIPRMCGYSQGGRSDQPEA
jgi:hypothetical protein